jgi:hypothetical protein
MIDDDAQSDDSTESGASDPALGDGASGEPYKVGFKRPPLHSRFRPGRSGNPKGRPRGRRNLKSDLHEELSEQITLREGDRQVRMTKQRALVKSTVARAIKGDPRAQAKVFELVLGAFGIDDEIRNEALLGADDEAIIAAFLARNAKGDNGGSK